MVLDYVATYPNAIFCYKSSDMVLNVDIDAAYLTMPEARRCYAGNFFLSDWPFPSTTKPDPERNIPIHTECKIISVVFVPLSQYTLSFSSTSLSINQCQFISHVFEHFGFIPNFTNSSVVEFSSLRGVAGCLWSNANKDGCILVDFLLLLEVPHVSA